MMTLLKYDFKRNWNTLLANLVTLIFLQIAVAPFLPYGGEIILAIVSYTAVGIATFVKVIKTYWANIRAYNRRLVPVSGLSHVLSPLLFGAICGLVLAVIGLIHFLIYDSLNSRIDIMYFINQSGINFSSIVALILLSLWVILFMSIIIFLSISIAGSFRWKTGPWIGIVAYFVITSLISWIENIIFSGVVSPLQVFHFTEESTGMTITSNGVVWTGDRWGSTIFEVIVAIGLVALTVYLNNKKVEV
ncbi:hypothetical protein [Paenibacillus tundrae]|uniref:hypothetical protein n=1 Tax=Paenibacillus tundrae TaxID=528187 RepID=UPI0030D382D1